jgi:ribosomal protein L11 methyltransferase
VKSEQKKSARCGDDDPFSPTSDVRHLISVYELKGSGRPRDVPAEGLEGIWPEPPFYYLFYRKMIWGLPVSAACGGPPEAGDPIVEWLKSHSDWRLTSRYDLPYEHWQDVAAHQISLGSFNVRPAAVTSPAPVPGDTPPFPSVSSSPAASIGDISILIDPGVVFGSGLHPTTQGCLLAISEIFESNEIRTAVDFGAGTGILAIACALAGARFVLAVDRNPLALKVARRNALANEVENRIAFVEADGPQCLAMRPDLFIINVEWPVLEKTLAAGHWRHARRVVLAGFLKSRLESVKRFAFPEFQVDEIIEREGWPTVSLKSMSSEWEKRKTQKSIRPLLGKEGITARLIL